MLVLLMQLPLFLLFIAIAADVANSVCFVSVADVAASVMFFFLLLFLMLTLLLLFVIVIIVVAAFDDDDDTTICYNNTKCVLIIQAKCFSSYVFLYSMLTSF